MTQRNDGGAVMVPLDNGGHAIVSACDAERILKYRWLRSTNGYAYRRGAKTKGVPCLLHRIVMDADPGVEIHHIDHDKLNCQRGNLLALSPSEHQEHHKHGLINRNRASKIYCDVGTCKVCGTKFTKHPDHRGRQTCCSKLCSIRLATTTHQKNAARRHSMLAARGRT